MRRWRRAVAAVAVVCQLFAATGLPLPVAGAVNAKYDARPYPCADRPCGCCTYDQCWAGDCCCFTLAEKVAWARARGVDPPARAVEATCLTAGDLSASCCRERATCPICEKPAPKTETPAARWVAGVFAAKCRGQVFAGQMAFAVAIPPEPPVRYTPDVSVPPQAGPVDETPHRLHFPPPLPPPRA